MSDTLREDILQSEAGQRMIETVTPIYDNSYVGLWMFEAMGREWDSFVNIIESLKSELDPDTATWMLPLWERRYGLQTDTSLSYDERRRKIRQRRTNKRTFNPRRVEQMAENITGLPARVVESIADYTFAVYLTATTSDDETLRRAIKRLKPSHMSFEIRYEQGVPGEIAAGGAISEYKRFTMAQVN